VLPMTYFPHGITQKITNIESKLGITTNGYTQVFSLPHTMSIDAAFTLTGVSVVSGALRLTAGASYLLEGSIPCVGINHPPSGVLEWAWYNLTTSSEIGQRCIGNLGTSGAKDTSLRCTRWQARALILASDFGANPTMDIQPRVVACSPLNGDWYADTWNIPPTTQEGTPQISVWRIT